MWGVTNNPTYNVATNDFTNPTDYTVNGTDNSGLNYIQLNEISSTNNTGDPIPGDDWVELINTAPVSININGVVLSDSEDSHALTLSSTNTEVGDACPGGSSSMGTTIPSGQFALILVDKSSYPGNFGLAATTRSGSTPPAPSRARASPIDHNEWPLTRPAATSARTTAWATGPTASSTPRPRSSRTPVARRKSARDYTDRQH